RSELQRSDQAPARDEVRCRWGAAASIGLTVSAWFMVHGPWFAGCAWFANHEPSSEPCTMDLAPCTYEGNSTSSSGRYCSGCSSIGDSSIGSGIVSGGGTRR